MSFCYDCSDRGYDMCFCKPIKQPNIKFVSEIDTIKKLQEENKNLEYESKKKDLIIENLTVFLKKYQNCEGAYTYREIQNEIYLDVHDYLNFINRAIAREALARVKE